MVPNARVTRLLEDDGAVVGVEYKKTGEDEACVRSSLIHRAVPFYSFLPEKWSQAVIYGPLLRRL